MLEKWEKKVDKSEKMVYSGKVGRDLQYKGG